MLARVRCFWEQVSRVDRYTLTPLSRLCFTAGTKSIELSCGHLCFPIPHLRIGSLSHACLRGRNQKATASGSSQGLLERALRLKEYTLSFLPSIPPWGVARGLLYPWAVLTAAPVPVCMLPLLSLLLHPSVGTPRTGKNVFHAVYGTPGHGVCTTSWTRSLERLAQAKAESLCILSGQDLSVLGFSCQRESKRRYLGSGASSLGGGTASSSSRVQASDGWSERPALYRAPS